MIQFLIAAPQLENPFTLFDIMVQFVIDPSQYSKALLLNEILHPDIRPSQLIMPLPFALAPMQLLISQLRIVT